MTDDDLPIARPLADYGPDTVEWVTIVERSGSSGPYVYEVEHADRRCPRVADRDVVDSKPGGGRDPSGWPCATCFDADLQPEVLGSAPARC